MCLGEPASAIPCIPEAEAPRYRYIPCFYETWNTSSLRVVENELDMAHFAFVHRGTFGDPDSPNPLLLEVTDQGPLRLRVRAEISVRPLGKQGQNIGATEAVRSTRAMEVTWHGPFLLVLSMHYPRGPRGARGV